MRVLLKDSFYFINFSSNISILIRKIMFEINILLIK